IGSDEIREAISGQVETIVETVHSALEQTPPELASDIVEKGIVLTGGGSLLKNLDVHLGKETSLSVTITEDPLSDVVIGSGKTLDNLSILKKIAIQ
ncbi:MAG: rod shape-determining protein, partial [Desulfobacteraceae bacterium 4484_190.2]